LSSNWLYGTANNVYLDGNGDLVIKPDANGGWTSGRIETRQDKFRHQQPARWR
jgi:hypothetical protein